MRRNCSFQAGLRNLFSGCGKVLGAQRLQPKPEYPDKTIGLLPTPQNKLPEKDKGTSSPKRGGQRNSDVLEKERVSSPQKPSGQQGNAFSGGAKDKAFGKPGHAGSLRRPQGKPAPHSPNRPQASPPQSQSPAPSAVAEHPQGHTRVDKPVSTRHLEFPTLPLGEDVEEKADDIALSLCVQSFQASNGWLHLFKSQRGLVYKTFFSEGKNVDTAIISDWVLTLPALISQYHEVMLTKLASSSTSSLRNVLA
ncbi:hypothetical protein HPB49_011378 [Dermacentor silvarum]|uniref:Uncharacterized protein n=1 Tax=Dermacentor silvarum TaxID=543639 RepID=A0ACB8DCU4_DERSI|nr:hypothetical protein HPB49_011378 [Dermacentor silvarum]